VTFGFESTTADVIEGIDLPGRTAVVTGASAGLGRETARVFAAAGAHVVLAVRDAGGKGAAAAATIAEQVPGASLEVAELDLTSLDSVRAFAKQFLATHDRIDLLVNNAGVIRDNPLAALEDDDIRVVLETNVTGAFNMSRAVAPYMVSKRRGKIINISSVSGEKGGRGQTNYAASKGALNAFTRALAVELAPRNINVNAVAPGVIETEMSREVRERAGDAVTSRILLRRIGRPEEVANAVWFLGSRYADYITGQVLNVDGGFKME
jgi:3-oxoacyl-[acyl-carrier protein] reductase